MTDKKITILIGKAIREGKYLSITYKNQNSEITQFWISILDINANGWVKVNMFNVTKTIRLEIKRYLSLKSNLLKFYGSHTMTCRKRI